MKLLISLLIASALYADSKTEKDLRAKVAAAEQERDEAVKSKAAAVALVDARNLSLHQEIARQAQELVNYKSRLQASMEARDALQSQLNAQLEAAKFQAKATAAIASVADHKPVTVITKPIDLTDLREIRKIQRENSELNEQRNKVVLQTTKNAAATAGATLAAVKSQTSATDRIKRSMLYNDVWLILVTLICDVLARIWYGRITSNRLGRLATLGDEHKQKLTDLNNAFERMVKESKKA